jgi:hypothetical protein
MPPCGVAGPAVRARLERGVERVLERGEDAVDDVASACASHTNHGSRESGSGIAPRACMPMAIASYSSWSLVAQSRYSVGPPRGT